MVYDRPSIPDWRTMVSQEAMMFLPQPVGANSTHAQLSYLMKEYNTVDLLRKYLPPEYIDLTHFFDGSEKAQTFHLYPVGSNTIKTLGNFRVDTRDFCLLMEDDRPFATSPLSDANVPPIDMNDYEWNFPYWEETVYINAMYAMRHGYQLLRMTFPKTLIDKGGRSSPWYKVAASLFAIRFGCRYVFFIDSDAFVAEINVPLDRILNDFNIGPSSKDPAGKSSPFMLIPRDTLGITDGNTGAFLIYNRGLEVQEFLSSWWKLPEIRPELQEFYKNGLYEQRVFNEGMRHHKGTSYVLTPMNFMTSPNGEFVRHYWADWKKRPELFHMEAARSSVMFLRRLLASMQEGS